MNYVIVNYGLNQIYTVYEQSFLQTVKSVFSKTDFVKLDGDVKIKFNNSNTNISIEAQFYIYENKHEFSDIINNLINSLRESIKLLIGIDAENISLFYKGKINKK
ncbi:MMB_0454 family protein [Mycoplasma sp. 480]|uniref:MMB_0454 family protein n=1 Tax=Mycoplasma sp. 480 TaxID=3440155 RepID=UPI003F510938